MHLKQIIYHLYYKIKRKFIFYFPSFYYNRLQKKITSLDSSVFLSSNHNICFESYCKNNNDRFDIDKIINNEYDFLNVSINFGKSIDWNMPDLNHGTRLWKLNLNYHEYLIEVAIKYNESKNEKYIKYIINHIGSWIENNPLGTKNYYKDNWNSYAISNRVIVWIKIFKIIDGKFSNKNKKLFLNSLRVQLEYLYRNIEYDLRANHLFENGFALLFGSYFFGDYRLLNKAENILNNEIEEQILNDGSHIELSPMYQQHILHRFLDCYNLVANHSNSEIQKSLLLGSLHKSSVKLLSYLDQITFRNGDIPLFNDSAFNIYPDTKELIGYAGQLDIQLDSIELDGSGFRKYENNNYECIMNFGGIKAHYMPGHSHSDIFNFILYVNEMPFIVDTGISTYNMSERRIIERSTASHNTVKIGDFEQIETWSSFRVAKRINGKIINDGIDNFKAELDYITTKAKHTREFSLREKNIKIIDVVNSNERLKAYLHFHPDIDVKISNDKIKTDFSEIIVAGSSNYYIDEFLYAPEFNKLIKSTVLIIEFENNLETQIKIL